MSHLNKNENIKNAREGCIVLIYIYLRHLVLFANDSHKTCKDFSLDIFLDFS
jgi:hypothetical protein